MYGLFSGIVFSPVNVLFNQIKICRQLQKYCKISAYNVLFLAVLSFLSVLLLASLLSPQHRLFCNETEECAQLHFSAATQPVESVGCLCMQHPGKCAFPWSDLLKSTYKYSCSSLPCCTDFKLWNAWFLIVPGIYISSANETLPAAVIQGAPKSKNAEDGSMRFLCSLGFFTGSSNSIWPSTEDHLGTQR